MRTIRILSIVVLLLSSSLPLLSGDVCCDSERWLEWSASERDIYVEAHFWAYMHGFSRGCSSASEAMQETKTKNADELFRRCLKKDPTSGRDATTYAAQITKYYKEHPKDQRRIGWLIDRLLEGKNLAELP
jgi:hypothetical protein